MSEDWSISPPLPDKVFPWKKYNPVTREEVNEFFYSPEILVIKERMCDIGRRLWNREYVDGNGGNIPCAWHRTCCSAPPPWVPKVS